MKVYVILREREDETEDYEFVSFADICSRGFTSFESAEKYILENGFVPVDKDNDIDWNEYRSASVHVFMSIKKVIVSMVITV